MSTELDKEADRLAGLCLKLGFKVTRHFDVDLSKSNMSVLLNTLRTKRVDGRVVTVRKVTGDWSMVVVGDRQVTQYPDGFRDPEHRSDLNRGTLGDAIYYLLEKAPLIVETPAGRVSDMTPTNDAAAIERSIDAGDGVGLVDRIIAGAIAASVDMIADDPTDQPPRRREP